VWRQILFVGAVIALPHAQWWDLKDKPTKKIKNCENMKEKNYKQRSAKVSAQN